MGDQANDECVICCSSEPPLYRICACATLVHESCAKRVVSEVESHKSRCPVCLKFYDFESELKHVWRCDMLAGILICIGMLGLLFPILPNIFMCTSGSRFCDVFHGILTGASVVGLIKLVYVSLFLRRFRGHWCPWFVAPDVQNKALKLPAPEKADDVSRNA